MPAYPGDRSTEIVAALGSLPSRTPASEVARRLLDLFAGGSIDAGTRLPPERQLAATLGVGRSAVREALAALEILGILDVRPGSGTYLRGDASALLPQTLRWGLLIGERNTTELLDLRSGLEIFVSRRAAANADDDTVVLIAASLEKMRLSLPDLDRFAKADRDFHLALSSAAGNITLVDLLHVVRSLLQVYDDRAVHDAGAARTAFDEHEAILAAVERGDEDGAASAMAVHMTTASARLKAETRP